jgi:hypothetical protein
MYVSLYQILSITEISNSESGLFVIGVCVPRITYPIVFAISDFNMSIFVVLQYKKIKINNLIVGEIDRFIFIKKLTKHSQNNEYWKYIIDGIEYYVPNHNYVMLFDIDPETKDNTTQNIEIDGVLDETVDDNDRWVFDALSNTLKSFKDTLNIPSNVKSIMTDICDVMNTTNGTTSDYKYKNISDLILHYLNFYVNNRTGTNMKTSEENKFKNGSTFNTTLISNIKKGDLVLSSDKLYIVAEPSNLLSSDIKVFSKNSSSTDEFNNYSITLITGNIIKPHDNENFEQTTKSGDTVLENYLTETYIINK